MEGVDRLKQKTYQNQKIKIMKKIQSILLIAVATFFGGNSFAQMDDSKMEKTVMVGGAAMYPTKNIVENAVNSKDHTTLVAAVKAAGLVETLQSAGPFTVFAPTNEAFKLLPVGTVDNLLKPESKAALTEVLTYHVVAGRISSASLAAMTKEGKGKAALKTVAGGNLYAKMKGNKIVITDEKGGSSVITIKDVNQSNGVIHVVDHVLLPKM